MSPGSSAISSIQLALVAIGGWHQPGQSQLMGGTNRSFDRGVLPEFEADRLENSSRKLRFDFSKSMTSI